MQDAKKEIPTPTIVTLCAPARPIARPNRPATMAPASGASGTIRYRSCMRVIAALPLELVQVVHVDRPQVAEQHHQAREPDRRLGRRHGQDEEHEDLARDVAEEVRERHEVEVDSEQHQLDHISRMMTFLRFRKMPTMLIANSSAASTRKCANVSNRLPLL